MKAANYFTILVLCLLVVPIPGGETGSMAKSRPYKLSVGFGWGTEVGRGLQLGLITGPHTVRAGLGFLINGEEGKTFYSGGLRYARRLFKGRLNNTYAWAGGGAWGRDDSSKTDYLMSAGLGLGLTYHFGLPVHLDADAGYRLYYDSRDDPAGAQLGITGNVAITYNW